MEKIDIKNNLMTKKEVIELLKISPYTLYKWTCYNYIPHLKVGGKLFFLKSEIEEWLLKKSKKGDGK